MLNKEHVKATILALTEGEFAQTQHDYELFLAEARIDRAEPVDSDGLAQANTAADIAATFDDRLHEYETKLAQLREIDFSPKQDIVPGAVIRSGNRYFVIAVSTRAFECDANSFIGISTAAPIYEMLRDTAAGDHCIFRGAALKVDEIY